LTGVDDELEITLRAPAEAAARAIVLASLLRRLALEPTVGEAGEDPAAEVFDLRQWLIGEGLDAAMTPREAEFIRRSPGSLTPNEIADISWQGEALAALAWALGLVGAQTPGRSAPIEPLLEAIPEPWASPRRWSEEAKLLPEPDIAQERERAEVWHWRAVAESLRRDASPRERQEIETAVREVTMNALASGLIETSIAADFAVEGDAVRRMPVLDLDRLVMTSRARLHALNWLCGFGDSWDDIPLDV
jgi:Domain of unknown function (DUF4272)